VGTKWDIVRYLHVVAMAFFVGGQLFLVAAVLPVERKNPDRERLRAVARNFGYGSLVAIAVLVTTGSMLASHFDIWSLGRLQLKLSLVALTAMFVVWHMRRPTMHALEGIVFVLSLVIVWLGLTLF